MKTIDIKEDVGDAYGDVVRSLKNMTKHVVEDPGDALSKSAAALMHSAVELAEQAKAQSQAAAKKIGEEVREHPAATAAIVAAAVALVGLALSQRRHKH
jgi:ElaB/YqjD/DUF883 family membrane-anchored ribosome-binding protein